METLSPEGVVKTQNTEHSGKSWNIPEHEKIKIIFMKKKNKKIKNNNNKMIFVKINNNVK